MAEPVRAAPRIHPVILSGGSGTRLWPMSRAHYPEAVSAAGCRSIRCCRKRPCGSPTRARFAPPLFIANDEHRFILAEQMRAVD